MLENVTGESIFAEILMLRQVDLRAFVLVEGPDDNDTLYSHIDHSSTRLIVAHGKRNLERAVELADASATPRVLGIRDRDFLGIVGSLFLSDNIVLTDYYDLDASLILATNVLDRVLPIIAKTTSVTSHLQRLSRDSAKDVLLLLANHIGLARLENERNGWSLRLSDFPLHEVVLPDCSGIDSEQFYSIAIARSDVDLTPDRLAHALDEAERLEIASEDLVCGHDLIRAIAHACRTVWGAASSGYQIVAAAVRSALSCEALKQLLLYKRVVEWEARTDARVLACR